MERLDPGKGKHVPTGLSTTDCMTFLIFVIFNFSGDIAEGTNQAAGNPAKLKELQAKLAAWESTLATPLW